MKQKFAIPIENYIVFQLVKVEGKNVSVEDTIYLAVLPESIDYTLQSRDAVVKTHSQVFTNKVDYAPEAVRISGTFGDGFRYMMGTYMDGWSRLKQFEDDVIRKSKKKVNPKGDSFYVINYYDYIFQRFGSVNVSTWNVSGQASTNTQLIRYNLSFVMTGEIILPQYKYFEDIFLQALEKAYNPSEGIYNTITKTVNGLVNTGGYVSMVAEVAQIAYLILNTAKRVSALVGSVSRVL